MSFHMLQNNTTSLKDLWYESHASILKMVAMDCNASDKIPELLEKYLGAKLKINAPKDPTKPKRAKSAFLCYCDRWRPGLIIKAKAAGKVNIGSIAKSLGKSWKALSAKERKPYDDEAGKDKVRYEHEIAEYNEKNGII